MKAQVDLGGLAVDRSAPASRGRRPSIVARYIVPAVILLGFGSLVAWAARSAFMPATPVDVLPVVATRSTVGQTGAPLFSAAGWVEPRPTAVQVTALAEGVVERLLVIEGQAVKQGEAVARLVAADARLSLRAAQAELELRDAELALSRATLRAAQSTFEQPVELEGQVAEARAALARTRDEQAGLPYQVDAARAKLRLANETLKARRGAADIVTGRDIQRSEAEEASAKSALDALEERKQRLEEQASALDDKLRATKKALELKIELKRARDEAVAGLEAAAARRRQAQVAVDEAALRLERMTVRSPIAGRVLMLIAQSGSRLMNQATEGSHATTVVTLYDPARLQVRADVRLEDVARVDRGQRVRVESAALATPIFGHVVSITSQADIQKNTLQVKVALKNPPENLKPDMLVQTTFLKSASAEPSTAGEKRLRIWMPKSLVLSDGSGTTAWIVDQAAGVAKRRTISIASNAAGELVEVTSGLNPGDRLIASSTTALRDGERVTISRELAIESSTSAPAASSPAKPKQQ